MTSLRGPNDAATEALRLRLYVDELDFQAGIALDAFGRAWIAAHQAAADEDAVWADLQSALFAGIIIDRMIRPSRNVRADPDGHFTRADAAAEAEGRAKALRELLKIPDDPSDGSPRILYFSPVRHGMEHIDSRFDGLVLKRVMSISDRCISDDGKYFRTYDDGSGTAGVNFRVFIPAAGLLIFDGEHLDMFMLDHHLLALKDNIKDARDELDGRIERTRVPNDGGFSFGGQQLVDGMPKNFRERAEQFQAERVKHGRPLKKYIRYEPVDA